MSRNQSSSCRSIRGRNRIDRIRKRKAACRGWSMGRDNKSTEHYLRATELPSSALPKKQPRTSRRPFAH